LESAHCYRLGNVPVNEITRSSVSTWLSQLTVGPWAKVSSLRLLRCVLEVAVADGRIAVNPAAGVSAPPIPARERHRYLTAAEVNTLAAALGDQGDVALVLAYTGLRWSELVGLRVMDVDLALRRLHVRRSAPEVEGKIVIGLPKTKASRRSVPLPAAVVEALRPHVTGRDPEAPAIPSPEGGMLRSNNWRRHTRSNGVIKRLHLAPLTIHELRHTCASLACASGASLHFVQKTMGHSSPTVTANIHASAATSSCGAGTGGTMRRPERSADIARLAHCPCGWSMWVRRAGRLRPKLR